MPTADFSVLGTVAGVATFTTILTQIILNAARPSDEASSRWGPILATGIGVVTGLVATFVLTPGADTQAVAQGAYTGFIGGAASIALHAYSTKSVIGQVIGQVLGIQAAPSVTGIQVTGSPNPSA